MKRFSWVQYLMLGCLCLALCLGVGMHASMAEDEESSLPAATEVTADGTAYTATFSPSRMAYFCFTPETSGPYVIYAEAEPSEDYPWPYITLYSVDPDGELQQMYYETVNGNTASNGMYAWIYAYLENNQTYYFRARYTDEAQKGSFPVTLKPYSGIYSLEAKDRIQSIAIEPNGTATLSVVATCTEGYTGKLTYRWQKEIYNKETGFYNSVVIEGADKETYTTDPSTENCNYYCFVYDENNPRSNSVFFNVHIDNELKATAVDSNPRVKQNETATLEVMASCKVGEIDYQWYLRKYNEDGSWNYEKLEGETEATFTTEPITQTIEYYCDVYDEYNNNRQIWFTVNVDTGLEVEDDNQYLEISPKATITLDSKASIDEGQEITYQWYRSYYYDNEGYHSVNLNDRLIEDANQSTYDYTNTTEQTAGFYCIVSDEFDNSVQVNFRITRNNHVTAKAVQSDIDVEVGQSVTLEVDASCDTGDITYQWYEGYYTNTNALIEGATASTYTIEKPESGGKEYYCLVRDEYDRSGPSNYLTVRFYVNAAYFFLTPSEITMESGEKVEVTAIPISEDYELTNVSWNRPSVVVSVKPNKSTATITAKEMGYVSFGVNCDAFDGEVYHYSYRSCIVHVVSPIETIKFAEGENLVKVGEVLPMTAYATLADESFIVNERIVFTSSDPEIAAIDEETGEVTGVTPGLVTITAANRQGTIKAETTVIVTCAEHKPVEDPEVAATCTETGLTKGSHCEVCGEILEEQEEVPALGHDWDEATYEWAEDYSTVTATRICKNDDKEKPEHPETETVKTTKVMTKAADCGVKGEHTYTAVFTNVAFKAQTKVVDEIDALEHEWNDPTYVWSEDNGTVTATRTCKHDNSHKETETVKTKNDISKEAGCVVNGETTYKATFENEAFKAQTKTVDNVEAPNHDWDEPTYIWSADNSMVTAMRICKRDESHVETETVKTKGKETKEATLKEKGETTYTATFKNAAFKEQTKVADDIPKLVAGDVNDDGVLDGRDTIRLMKYLAGETDPETGEKYTINEITADLNGDGKVDELDLLRLMKILSAN